MSPMEQQAASVSARHMLFVCVGFVASISLQGCSNHCPEMLPIENGRVKMVCENYESNICKVHKIECNVGYEVGLLREHADFKMKFKILQNQFKKTKCASEWLPSGAPPFCNKCLDNDNIRIANGSVKIKKGANINSIETDPESATVTCENGNPGGPLLNFADRSYIAFLHEESSCVIEASSEACGDFATLPDVAAAGGDALAVESDTGDLDDAQSAEATVVETVGDAGDAAGGDAVDSKNGPSGDAVGGDARGDAGVAAGGDAADSNNGPSSGEVIEQVAGPEVPEEAEALSRKTAAGSGTAVAGPAETTAELGAGEPKTTAEGPGAAGPGTGVVEADKGVSSSFLSVSGRARPAHLAGYGGTGYLKGNRFLDKGSFMISAGDIDSD